MLRLEHIKLEIESLPILDDISLYVADDEIVAIIGPSGCGKSTLLDIIAGLKTPDAGTMEDDGYQKAFVFQDDRLLPWRTVWKNISIVNDVEKKEEIEGLLAEVGLQGFENYYPDQLSGGMKKRCGIARAFYYHSGLLLMDEPFQGLDYCLRNEMLHMLLRVWEKHKQGVLFITHEIDEALMVANRILVLSNRPAKIIKEIKLPAYEERKNQELLLNQIRQDIIAAIT